MNVFDKVEVMDISEGRIAVYAIIDSDFDIIGVFGNRETFDTVFEAMELYKQRHSVPKVFEKIWEKEN